MANSKRMLEDLHDMASQQNVPAGTFRSLMASALADLFEKIDKVEECVKKGDSSREQCFDNIKDELRKINEEIRFCKTELVAEKETTRRLAKRVETNPAIRLGNLWKDYPWIFKAFAALVVALFALGGVQSLINFIQTIGLFGI